MVDSLDCLKGALRWLTVVVLAAFVPGASGTAQESRPRDAQLHQDETAVVHIPEPMVFDLVRGLGAKQGEAEVNVLGLFPLRTSDPHGVVWAPEIEAAVLDGFALEFELPLEDTHLEAVKFAAQYTFGTAFDHHFIHGVQGIAEWFRDAEEWEATLIYLAGVRIDETWSLLSMFGFRTGLGSPNDARPILNVSVFADVNHALTIGLESDYEGPVAGDSEFILMPQVHYALGDRYELQAGVGAVREGGDTLPKASARFVVEF